MKKLAYLLFGLALLIGGCTGLPSKMEQPTVTISSINLLRATFLEQTYQMQLRIQNPNDFALQIDGLSYELEVNDKPFAKGLSNKPITVPQYGTELLEVEGISTLASLLRQFSEMDKSQTSMHYHLKGKLNLRNAAIPIPFNYKGEVAIPTREKTL